MEVRRDSFTQQGIKSGMRLGDGLYAPHGFRGTPGTVPMLRSERVCNRFITTYIDCRRTDKERCHSHDLYKM